jgi:hypothetical protein
MPNKKYISKGRNTMEFENMDINNVEEVVDVIEEVVPKKGFEIPKLGKGIIIGALATATVVAAVNFVKKVRAKKAVEVEELVDNDEDCINEDEYDYSDVEGK